jgi:ERCC4-type nuclease
LLNLYHYSDSEIKKILQNIVIIVDTREQKNKHITDYFVKHNIKYINRTLQFADYSFMLPAMPEYGISRDIYFDNQIVAERKAHLEELSQNLAQKREQFENEWLRSKDCKKFLIIEKGCYDDIICGNYDTEYKAESYFASLLSFSHRYNLRVVFLKPVNTGKFIYAQFYYYLREMLKG